jgi:hypothetical protein
MEVKDAMVKFDLFSIASMDRKDVEQCHFDDTSLSRLRCGVMRLMSCSGYSNRGAKRVNGTLPTKPPTGPQAVRRNSVSRTSVMPLMKTIPMMAASGKMAMVEEDW